jgi:hypothetical protein
MLILLNNKLLLLEYILGIANKRWVVWVQVGIFRYRSHVPETRISCSARPTWPHQIRWDNHEHILPHMDGKI